LVEFVHDYLDYIEVLLSLAGFSLALHSLRGVFYFFEEVAASVVDLDNFGRRLVEALDTPLHGRVVVFVLHIGMIQVHILLFLDLPPILELQFLLFRCLLIPEYVLQLLDPVLLQLLQLLDLLEPGLQENLFKYKLFLFPFLIRKGARMRRIPQLLETRSPLQQVLLDEALLFFFPEVFLVLFGVDDGLQGGQQVLFPFESLVFGGGQPFFLFYQRFKHFTRVLGSYWFGAPFGRTERQLFFL